MGSAHCARYVRPIGTGRVVRGRDRRSFINAVHPIADLNNGGERHTDRGQRFGRPTHLPSAGGRGRPIQAGMISRARLA